MTKDLSGTWLVTGGAGYIGSHVLRSLARRGHELVVLDDLSTGRLDRVPPGVDIVVGSVLDAELLSEVMDHYRVSGVVHLAARKAVSESVQQPLRYYRENVGGFTNVLEAATRAKVRSVVLSSTAAVYGAAGTPLLDAGPPLLDEDAPTDPANPYGMTKVVCEQMLADVGAATGLNWISLRYFNVAGTTSPHLADTSATNLIPRILDVLADGRYPELFGVDYPTADGTCVRDFVHVEDLAEAHGVAVERSCGGPVQRVYNVGRGTGSSVREVVAMAHIVTGVTSVPTFGPRRPGDVPHVVADVARIEAELGWKARRGLREMVESTWTGLLERRAGQLATAAG